ncbi:MAG: hypothetical protein CL814_03335 [Confluentimicrobium sp.]|mgnify:CR=1 FL=1|jgi:hypothetical protein|uniref:hypothetical protein n=1 Tax=Actibacterium sp. TaxID=1872125 RepID=UPI000C4C3217|nr:hypothetical protein [Actibacterium sp.]MBC55949.1 hypothetical protein [Actibacterium sp.]
MIIANMATYPPRRAAFLRAVAAVAPQVDQLNLVLNEYDAIPRELAGFGNVTAVIPDEDLKDVGKFLPDSSAAEHVFTMDDDILYPADYVATTLSRLAALRHKRVLAGYHGSLYRGWPRLAARLGIRPNRIAAHRRQFRFRDGLAAPVVVDQLGSGVSVMRGCDFPPFDFMKGSQGFVDVRLARWCHEHGILPVCLPRAAGWLSAESFDEALFYSVTQASPPHVAREIWEYAFRVRGRGRHPDRIDDPVQ